MCMSRCVVVVSALTLASTAPAFAVPGWSTTSTNLPMEPVYCRSEAEGAIKTVTSGNVSPPSQTYSALGSLTAGYVDGAAIFIYCLANSSQVCKHPSSTMAVVAFSDKGSEHAKSKADQVLQVVGHPQPIDCN